MDRNEAEIPTKRYDHPPYHTHTPGPWHVSEWTTAIEVRTPYNGFGTEPKWTMWSDQWAYAVACGDEHGGPEGFKATARADAHLIAAAPELLDTLSAILKETDQTDRSRASLEYIGRIARAAIAKAEGRA